MQKLDQGACAKVHSKGLKAKYEEDMKARKAAGLEPEWYKHLKAFTDDTDRKTRRVEQQLTQTQDMDPALLDEGLKVNRLIACGESQSLQSKLRAKLLSRE